MKKLTVGDVKKGEKYFFVDTDFTYIDVPKPIIKQRTVYKIIGTDYSTKDKGDTYEVERVFAFPTKGDAIKYSLKELEEYRDYINKKIDKTILLVKA